MKRRLSKATQLPVKAQVTQLFQLQALISILGVVSGFVTSIFGYLVNVFNIGANLGLIFLGSL